jgi:hypothetical protein
LRRRVQPSSVARSADDRMIAIACGLGIIASELPAPTSGTELDAISQGWQQTSNSDH